MLHHPVCVHARCALWQTVYLYELSPPLLWPLVLPCPPRKICAVHEQSILPLCTLSLPSCTTTQTCRSAVHGPCNTASCLTRCSVTVVRAPASRLLSPSVFGVPYPCSYAYPHCIVCFFALLSGKICLFFSSVKMVFI